MRGRKSIKRYRVPASHQSAPMVARDQAMLRLREVGYLCEIRKDGADRTFIHYSRLSSKGKLRMFGGKVFQRDLETVISPGGK